MQGGSNVKISLLGGDFVLVHFGDRGSECGDHCRAIGKSRTGGNLGYAGSACVFRETESVKLGNNLSPDKLACESAKSDIGGLLVVHIVNRKHPTSVKVAPHGLVGQRDIAVNITAVTAIIAESAHVELGNYKLICVCPGSDKLCCAVKVGSKRRDLINLVKHRHKLFCKCYTICH